ncbi:pectin methylesterase-like acyl-CoA thioesterase [Paenibacillus prosopidis]|uniref:Pectin methylesterase-like acyl-CoA thioesterase n=2 Tax=Paenibacillus prosopidis TaxID=630520 RepID=A0A368W2A7_9BACL|nr:pectin methylesterase-like acyl-CoA thioesterase [Paenibacillus prosopidis]
MKWLILAAMLFGALNFQAFIPTASALEYRNDPPYYNVTDSTLPGKLLDALNHRTLPFSESNQDFRDVSPVIVIAHRGVVDHNHPENTKESAVNVMNYGIEAMELDVYQTSDYVPYLFHDQTLTRMLDRPEYSDIYRWEREGSPAGKKPLDWGTISQLNLCYNGVDGYGKTAEHPTCASSGIHPSSLYDTLHELYMNSYQGFVFLDLRGTENVRDVATLLSRYFVADDADFGTWIASHVVLKFATTFFDGPADYSAKVRAHYQERYGETLSEYDLSFLYVMPVYFSDRAYDKEQQTGDASWAINDFTRWKNWFDDQDKNEGLLAPEIEIKATGAVLNNGADDLFTETWQSGRSVGVYVPKKLCTRTVAADPNYLGGDSGTWWEGGVCGPLGSMNEKECGSSGQTAVTVSGGGCTDHRFLSEFWHDTAKFGFIITDTPVDDINYLAKYPGQRPGQRDIGVRFFSPPNIQVAADGSGDYSTIAAAIAALPQSGGIIEVAPGTYKEKLLISKNNVALVGMGTDASKVKITGNDYNKKINPATGQPYGTSGSATVTVTGSDFYATNLTFENTANYEAPGYEANEQAVALLTKGDRAVYRAVMFLGGQDTLYVHNNKRAYFNNSYVEGYVDFIFGNGKAVFDNTTIKAKVHTDLRGQVTITAQKRESASEDSGFVFNNNTLLFDDQYMDNVWLGRPWGAYSTVYFLNTKMGPQVKTPGWIEFIPAEYAPPGVTPTNYLPTSTYREYKTLYPDGNGGWTAFDIGQRESVSPNTNVPLSDAEAAALAADTYLKGADDWKPTAVTYGSNTNQTLPIPTLPIGAPGAPTIYSVTAGNKNLQVSWGGKPANPQTSGYRIWATQNGQTFGPVEVPPTATSGYIGGLANGVPAQVHVAGVNAQGVGQDAVSASFTPVSDAPSVPENIRFQLNGSSVTIGFDILDEGSQPVFNGAEHHGVYTALYASKNDAYAGKAITGTSQGFTTPTYTFNNLQANTTYWVSLWAHNGKDSPKAITSFHTGPISGFQYCSWEGQTCSFSGEKLVAFGANGWFSYQTATNSISCSNAVFGDPQRGTGKACYVK